MNDETNEFLPARQSLRARLKDLEDQTSWQEFFDTYWKLVYAEARKAGLSDVEAQVVVQEVVVSVAKEVNNSTMEQTCPFKEWVLQIVRRQITDQLGRRR